jgi:LmbE family N-acetylglucosaminyl deacetylase
MQPMPEDWNRAVAVVAHPDDLEYGVASAVARWTGQGKQVAYLLATRGEAGIAGLHPDQAGPLRAEEERRSAAIVGVREVEFLDHRDGLVEYGIPLRRDLAAAFRRLQPEVVIAMSFDLTWGEEGPVNHSDHRAVGLAVLDACRDAANEWVFPEAGPPCRGIRDAYLAATGNPTHFTDVTATIDAGIASLREHRAYLDGLGGEFDPDEFLRNMAGFIGLAAGCDYGGTITYWNAARARVGWEFGFGLLPININDSQNLPGTFDQVIQTFSTSVPGSPVVVPQAPYSGGPSGYGQLTIPDVASPGGSQTVPGLVTGTRTLDVMLYNLRLGPTLHWDLSPRWGVSVSAGPAFGIEGSACPPREVSHPSSHGGAASRAQMVPSFRVFIPSIHETVGGAGKRLSSLGYHLVTVLLIRSLRSVLLSVSVMRSV